MEQQGQQNVQMAKPLVKKFPAVNHRTGFIYLGAAVVMVLIGVLTGWRVSGISGNSSTYTPQSEDSVAPGALSEEKEAGIADESTFSDSAEGTLEKGGLSGEGTHHLVRGEDESKYVVLTSTVIDLDSFVGKKIIVWGQSLSSEKATWLMDVGKLRVTE